MLSGYGDYGNEPGKLISIREKKPFPHLVALDIMVQIARGMCYLQDLGIAHRDLKPDNVMLNKVTGPYLVDAFCVKLVDFGMSKTEVEVSKSHTISVDGVGTTTYRPPEAFPKAQRAQEVEAKAHRFKADVYSFAVTCAHMLTLNGPYEGVPNKGSLYSELMTGRRPELPKDCPPNLFERMLEFKPSVNTWLSGICTRLEELRQVPLRRQFAWRNLLGSKAIKNEIVRGTHTEKMLRKCSEPRQLQVSLLKDKRFGMGKDKSTLIHT